MTDAEILLSGTVDNLLPNEKITDKAVSVTLQFTDVALAELNAPTARRLGAAAGEIIGQRILDLLAARDGITAP